MAEHDTNVTGQTPAGATGKETIRPKIVPIPPPVRRNTVLISVNQALFSGVNQSMVMIAGLSILLIMGSTALAGFASAIVIGGRVLIVYSAGKMMDRVGRKRVLYSGAVLGLISLAIVIAALSLDSTAMLWAGIFVFGIASGMIQLNRVAVMDMYPLPRRGEGMGYYLTGSVVGSLMAIMLTLIAAYFAIASRDQYVIVVMLCMVLLAIATLFIWMVRPDTEEIGKNLKNYYPEFAAPVAPCASDKLAAQDNLRTYPMRAGFTASAFAWGTMVMGMSLVSVILKNYGVGLTLISIAIAIHVFGMFGLSIPLGRWADRVGRRPIIALGGVILLIGALIMPLTREYVIVVIGVFLIGLGWSGVNVGTTALICDLTPLARRGKVLGLNDMATGAASILLPLIGSAALGALGYLTFGLLGLAFSLPVLLILLVRETSPGKYEL